jgi:hypothetical protein
MTENACCQIEDIIGKESNEENGFIEWRTDPSSDNISLFPIIAILLWFISWGLGSYSMTFKFQVFLASACCPGMLFLGPIICIVEMYINC